MKTRAAVEPVIGHVKAEHRMGRNYLKGRRRPQQRRAGPRRLQLLPPRTLAGDAFARPHPHTPRLATPQAALSPIVAGRLLNQHHPALVGG
jgi:hypothetical protein